VLQQVLCKKQSNVSQGTKPWQAPVLYKNVEFNSLSTGLSLQLHTSQAQKCFPGPLNQQRDARDLKKV